MYDVVTSSWLVQSLPDPMDVMGVIKCKQWKQKMNGNYTQRQFTSNIDIKHDSMKTLDMYSLASPKLTSDVPNTIHPSSCI